MVKELEDAPRDEVAVVLDADPAAVVGGELRRAGARRRLDPARPRAGAAGAPCSSSTRAGASSSACTRARPTGGRRSSCSPPSSRRTGRRCAALLADEGRVAGRGARAHGRDRVARRRGWSTGWSSARSAGTASRSSYVDAASFGERAARAASRRCCGCRRPAWPVARAAPRRRPRRRLGARADHGRRPCLGRSRVALPLAGALIAWSWLRLEDRRRPAAGASWSLLALLPALVPALAPPSRSPSPRFLLAAGGASSSPSGAATSRRARLALRAAASSTSTTSAAVRRRPCTRACTASLLLAIFAFSLCGRARVAARRPGLGARAARRRRGLAGDAAHRARPPAAARSSSRACWSCSSLRRRGPPRRSRPRWRWGARRASPPSAPRARRPSPRASSSTGRRWDLYTRPDKPVERLATSGTRTTAASSSRRR